MTHILWSEALNTHIPKIDKQHQQLVSYVNELDDAIGEHDRNTVNHVLEELIEYTVFHFKTEEELMAKINYKHFEPHKRTHNIFIQHVGEYKQRFETGEDIAQELYDVLVHWLLQHIKHEDQGYAAEIRHYQEAIAAQKEDVNHGFLTKLKRFFGFN